MRYNDPLNKTDPTGLRPCDGGFGHPETANDLRYDAVERPDPVPGAKSLQDALKKDGRCLLNYNGTGEGKASVVVGDLSAKNIMIELAATDTSLANFTDMMTRASTIKGSYSDFAVIVYQDYETPHSNADVLGSTPSDQEFGRLAKLVNGLRSSGKHVSMLGHSWAGSVAYQSGITGGANPHDIVLAGSYRTGGLPGGWFNSDRLWTLQNDDDPAATAVVSPSRRLSSAGSSGHNYWSGYALTNIQAVGRGRFTEVKCHATDPGCNAGY